MKKRLSSVVIVSTVLAGTLVAPIATFADNYDSQIEQKNSEINDLKSKQSEAQSQIDSLESSINKINKKADELLKEQSTLREETVQLQKDIEVLTERIAKREEAIRNQARDVQVNNQSSVYVKALLDATSFTDALGRLKAMTTIVNANNDLVNQQKADKKAVEDKKAENEAKQEEIAKNQATLEEQKGTLEAKQADLNVLKASLAEQQATKESEKQALAEQKAAFEAEQKRVREQQAQAAAVQQAAQQAQQATGSTSTNNASSSSSSSSQASSSNSTSSNTSSSNAGVSNVVIPSTPAPAPSGNGSAIVAEAYKHIGKPYVWGAKGPDTFDCSGFTRYVYLQVTGRDIGGWTVPQEGAGTVIPVSQAQPGDLYFWGSRGSSYHVAIALGGGSYIHAPQPGESVKVGSVAYFAPSFAVRM
ncbi:NlpC/P60 family protein [Enterococcus cecorum]|nr:NlpC/P60 family protein [Enterococcus cecorum]MDZ5503234.1 NlpC/P60 family protein [Enterococcus cecorum]MDZ5557088.1 NlpC/P60 family protein [Enterococcus cecorum]MDZ5559185.1 NlpC/P60 family protein [Enterococcus cecorum]MDZ5592045.1 NlpC/P60 family protein [Enterococcus cecorum]MDZ5612865.1 NlpC/P60 family protein [Enterococcus cecorum]